MEPSPFGESSSRLSAEQILNSIKQEYKRIQKRKHLDAGYHHSECCYSPESPSQSSTMNVSSMPGTSAGGVSPARKEQPLFTLRQVGMICERLLKEKEDTVREEYEETMTSRLADSCTPDKMESHEYLKIIVGDVECSLNGAQHAERLRVEVLQQGQLHHDRAERWYRTCGAEELNQIYTQTPGTARGYRDKTHTGGCV
ncbi:Akirin-2 [Liparis tanakae]|uniref:Akirin-2 n=1 Tax=Liparis tanakae TaxID=230148 RepID=A0A4Z2IQ73_9TELE|nr:Akirin-2 [Liparis tanakae]